MARLTFTPLVALSARPVIVQVRLLPARSRVTIQHYRPSLSIGLDFGAGVHKPGL